MSSIARRDLIAAAIIATVAANGCILAAAGAGAGGAIYVGDRGVESQVAAPVDRSEQLFAKFVRYVNAVAAKQYPPVAKKKTSVAHKAPKKKSAGVR